MNNDRSKHRLFRLLEKRERWGLTWLGWIVVGIIVILPGLICVQYINDFLVVDCPVNGQVLVVEGWIPDYALPGAVSKFEKHNYRLLIAVGGPIEKGTHFSYFKSYAEFTQARLESLGLQPERMVAIATKDIKKDRTYEAAMIVKRWLLGSGIHARALDVYTLGAHARRSRLLFKKAFGDDTAVGVIAADDQSYDPKGWWMSSNGVRTVVSELIAYIYAVAFFHP